MNIPIASVEHNGSEIAIIGMAGQFPGAKNVDEFWQNLQNGVESISFFTDEELLAYGLDAATLNNPKFVKSRAVLEDVELFDAAFFGFNPREAEITDPQHRLFLECAYIALEDAGYDSENYQGSIGVYAGASLSRYLLNIYLNEDIIGSIDNHQLAIANDKDYLTTRVSYKLNLQGPSFTVQTACSTSLVAVHLATQSLLNGECDLALAGGVSISSSRKTGYLYKEGGIGSPDGHCRTFDAQAQGTVGGEGAGIVVLKRLEDALADGDTIHAVIKGSAINNDGSFKVSYTAPRIDGQAKVIRTAQVVADVEPETITYIEAHGTGTTLGDPIEIAALTQAFRASTEKKGFCAIGSVKTNIGHLDAAAGVTGLIKTVLALKNQQIPPSLHFQEPNPQIDFANSPFYVNTKLTQWKTNGIPRRAGVSSFGIGGTNAHVILEEAPVEEQGRQGESGRKYHLLVLSAKTESALETAMANLANHLKQHPNLNFADVAHTLSVGRRAFDHRRMVVCQDMNDALKVLSPLDSQRVFTQYQQPVNRPVVFMFSGQGTQYVNMGRELYESEPIFTLAVDRCCELLKPHLGFDLRHVLYPDEAQTAKATEQLKQTIVAQPALFAIEYALAQLWMRWGVHPEAMIGHSIGEYVAATLAGVFSLEDALALVAIRGRLMQQLPSGEMLSVQLPESEIQPLLNRELSLAASNGPSYCVVSGTTEAIAQLQQQLEAKGVGCRRLHTSHAFHSQMMEPILQPFTEQLQKLQLHPATIPFVSNVSGTWITVAEATDPKYWVKHLRQTVRFSEGITELLKTQERIFLEVGPGRTLSTFTKQHHKDQQVILTSIRHPQEQQSDVAFLLNSLGRLWLFGVKVDWSGFYANEQRHHIPLPTYPFERQRYWIEAQKQALHSQGFVEVAAVSETKAFGEQIFVAQPAASSVTDSAPTAFTNQDLLAKKSDIADWFYIPSWKRTMPPQPQPGLGEKSGCWLVFVDECGLGEKLVKQLLLEKQDVISVRVGEQFQQISEYSKLTYTINPQKEDEYNTLLKELRNLGKIPKRIVHLWSVTPNIYTNSAIEALGWSSLLFLAQAITENNQTDALEISIVSNNLQEVTGSEILCPEKALVLGACKVMPLEYPNITCRSIDVVVPVESNREEQLITTLIGELTTYTSDQIIAYRGRNRWVQDFEPVQLHETVTENLRLRKQGVYLITGGLGGVGLELAEYLAQTVQAKLILLGRSAFLDQDKWSEWLSTHDQQNRISQKIQKLQAMKALGAEVMIVSADVTNLDQMSVVLNKSNQRFGEIHGVIHAAAVYGGGMMQLTTKETVASALAPKVQGTRVLETLFQESQLDFFVLCSSLNSFVGESGMADYTAGNAFIDSFAHYSTSKYGTWKFVKSINWDRWNSVGMAIAIETRHQEITGEELAAGMVSFEGIEAFRRILCSSTVSQVIVSTQDFSSRIKAKESPKSFEEKLAQLSQSKPTHPRPNLTNVYVAPSNEIERTLADVWQQLLGIEKVGTHDNFFELGGDSLFVTQLVSQMCKVFQIELSYKGFFNGPTIAELAEVIVQKLSEQTNLEELAQALADIEQLSEHEMQTLIASQN
ncbi:polyketide synthase [Nostoc sp. 'Peltigera membranacea cyanobiont' 210A]|uniref:type I polyketide synthase n=1 Tax=Nostoc sp. 'Peltigera membranacea cyanobiont' 210A TaxID=2014529 RepID=UPI000B957D7A|nr:type I polyketide synthase [Nostoc sp. 'Peltigera membranacea cyanobiont' 210A]OYD97946.1 polyketide synthase [Nostoc sp. 'Peltigera membranacea cyanobiont' 210A]